MLTKGINFINFKNKKTNPKVKYNLKNLIKKKNYIIKSLSNNYIDSFNISLIKKYIKYLNYRIIGIGGSVLGAKAIYQFLNHKIKKKFIFLDNLNTTKQKNINKKFINFIISKSGNTIETIVNSNIYIGKKDHNIFITENKKNYLHNLAKKLKSDIVHHHNFIGGRYSVLSEVGMLPAEMMGLNPKKFRQLNSLIKNKNFLNALIRNVESTLYFIKNRKFNSIIINYDKKSENLFLWYQQLVAESLGKKNKGLLPIVSTMPRDNHSVMQLYLDGFKNNFYTFFYTHDVNSPKINNNKIYSTYKFLKNKNLSNIIYAQKKATENVFRKKNIPFRSFEIKKRSEETLGELFCFFILETILLGKSLNLNPYDQPSVELIKKQTKNILL